MPKGLVELALDALTWPQILISFLGEPQLISHAWDGNQFLVIHLRLMSTGQVALFSRPSLVLFWCIVCVPSRQSLLRSSFVHSHGLGTTTLTRLGQPSAPMFYRHFFLDVNVGNNSSPDLAKRLCPIPYQRIVERPWQNPPSKGVEHQSLVLSVKLYHQRSKLVQEILRGLLLILLHPKEVERNRGWSSVNYELFLEQCRKLIKWGYVAI